ncbi:polyprenyl synthetase family protein [Candidatus Saccharibacteria bacterium]|nr:polyprenyl synthetase family protein [Candidatus Saccharibacteria bacterium]
MSKTAISEELKTAISQIKTDIDRELAIFFDVKIAAAGRIDPDFKRLVSEMKKFALRGGKRLRPFMAWLGYQVAGGKDYPAFLQTAVAWELYHNFAVIHDDIMDNDATRYGGPNIIGVYERQLKRTHTEAVSHHHARNAALLAGDVALGFAFEILQNAPVEPEVRDRLIREMWHLHFSLAAGQLLDDQAGISKEIKVKRIRKIYHYKTARYSMVVPLQSGAVMAGANATILEILEHYGEHAGIAFQIADDLLGMFGSSREIGKPNISDLREGKQTILMHYGFDFASETDKRILKTRFGNPAITTADLKLVRKVLTENGAKAKTIFIAQAEAEAAKKAIARLAMPGSLPQLFIDFTDYLVNRSS